MGSEGRSLVPGGNRARQISRQPEKTQYHRVPHRPRRGHPRSNVRPQNPIDRPIEHSSQKRQIACTLPERWQHTHRAQQCIRAKRQNNAHERARDHGRNAQQEVRSASSLHVHLRAALHNTH